VFGPNGPDQGDRLPTVCTRYTFGMAKTKKVTITVPSEVADALTEWADTGRIRSVSAFVAESVQQRMERETSLAKLKQAFGAPPPTDLVDRVLRKLGRSDLVDGAA
jgi:antitoxin ParD1/3/4